MEMGDMTDPNQASSVLKLTSIDLDTTPLTHTSKRKCKCIPMCLRRIAVIVVLLVICNLALLALLAFGVYQSASATKPPIISTSTTSGASLATNSTLAHLVSSQITTTGV